MLVVQQNSHFNSFEMEKLRFQHTNGLLTKQAVKVIYSWITGISGSSFKTSQTDCVHLELCFCLFEWFLFNLNIISNLDNSHCTLCSFIVNMGDEDFRYIFFLISLFVCFLTEWRNELETWNCIGILVSQQTNEIKF